jgi:hypothetical protein
VVAQYRAYADVASELWDARARLGELDSAEAKRAWLRREEGYASQLRDEIIPISNSDWYQARERLRYRDLVLHWEAGVGERLRRDFPSGSEKAFTRADDGSVDEVSDNMFPLEFAAYVERRRARLEGVRNSVT